MKFSRTIVNKILCKLLCRYQCHLIFRISISCIVNNEIIKKEKFLLLCAKKRGRHTHNFYAWLSFISDRSHLFNVECRRLIDILSMMMIMLMTMIMEKEEGRKWIHPYMAYLFPKKTHIPSVFNISKWIEEKKNMKKMMKNKILWGILEREI